MIISQEFLRTSFSRKIDMKAGAILRRSCKQYLPDGLFLKITSLDRNKVNQKVIIYMFILPKFWFPRRGFVQENSHL